MQRKSMGPGDYVVAALFAATLVVVAAQVLWRYVLNDSLVWTEEASRYLFVWMTFIGAALALKEGTHIRITVFVDGFSAAVRRVLRLVEMTLVLALLVFLTVVGFRWVHLNADTPTPALRLPLNLVLYASLPVGCMLSAWYVLVRMVGVVRNEKLEEPRAE